MREPCEAAEEITGDYHGRNGYKLSEAKRTKKRSVLFLSPEASFAMSMGTITKHGLPKQPSLGTITPTIGTRSTCGVQVRSTYVSNPSFGFGTASRETAQKRFISDEHKSKEQPTWTPGPGSYQHRVTTGKQSSSFQKSAPKYGFGTAERFSKIETKRAAAVPGPGAYTI